MRLLIRMIVVTITAIISSNGRHISADADMLDAVMNSRGLSLSVWSFSSLRIQRHAQDYKMPPGKACALAILKSSSGLWTRWSPLTPGSCRRFCQISSKSTERTYNIFFLKTNASRWRTFSKSQSRNAESSSPPGVQALVESACQILYNWLLHDLVSWLYYIPNKEN